MPGPTSTWVRLRSRTVGDALAEQSPAASMDVFESEARLAAAVWRTASATVPSEIWQR